jgi:hypothetical protein
VEALGIPADEVTKRIGISESDLGRWITGSLSVEEADVIEVGLAMLEMRQRRMDETQPLHVVTAA